MFRHDQQTAYKRRQMYNVQYRLVERQADASRRWEGRQKQTGRQTPVDWHVCKSVAGMQTCSQTQAGRHTTLGRQFIGGKQANAGSNSP